VAVETLRTPADYEDHLRSFLRERSEEARAVRVGEKETSEQAAIFERYRDLFSRGQLEALREAEAAADGEERERIYRLRKSCEDGLVAEELVEQSDAEPPRRSSRCSSPTPTGSCSARSRPTSRRA
jgi:hypothetical protein